MPKIVDTKSDFGKTSKQDKKIYVALLVGSAIALLASLVLSVEAIELAKNKDAILPCSISEVLNCATVGSSDSASIFMRIPNSFFGMLTLPVMVTIAVAGLAGVRFPRWFMNMALLGAFLGVVFAIWMFYTSYVVIQVLCPWCLTLDVGMLFIAFAFWRYVALYNTLGLSEKTQNSLKAFSEKGFDTLVIFLIGIAVVISIIFRFGDALFL